MRLQQRHLAGSRRRRRGELDPARDPDFAERFTHIDHERDGEPCDFGAHPGRVDEHIDRQLR